MIGAGQMLLDLNYKQWNKIGKKGIFILIIELETWFQLSSDLKTVS